MIHASAEGLQVPAITTEQMREVDRLMIGKYNVQLIQMMENAGRNLAEMVRRLLGTSVKGKHTLVAAGKGNNGGGGMVAARHLYNWGAEVTVLLPKKALNGIPENQLNILETLPIELKTGDDAVDYLSVWNGDIVADALIGYGLSGKPHGWTGKMIDAINALTLPVVSLDVPSGLDATTGEIYEPCIRAKATMTLALPKKGLVKPEARRIVGDLYLADIGVPDVLYKEIGINVGPIFLNDSIMRIDGVKKG